jgi:hypothetical protein
MVEGVDVISFLLMVLVERRVIFGARTTKLSKAFGACGPKSSSQSLSALGESVRMTITCDCWWW